MSRWTQSGVTLIELMIVVVVIGILLSVAVFMYTRTTDKAKVESEVAAMFAEFKTRQHDYHAERGQYLTMATGGSDDDPTVYHPTPPNMNKATLLDSAGDPMPAEWVNLRLSPNKNAVYCAYTTIAGAGGDDTNLGARAALFGMTTAPATNWFYVIAECDVDGNPALNSLYFTRSDIDGIASQNEGR